MSSFLKTDIIECNSDFGVGNSGDFTNTTAPQIIPKGSQISIDGSIVQQISAGTDNIIELSNRNGLNKNYVSSYNSLRVNYWISNNGNNGATLPLICTGKGKEDTNSRIISPSAFPSYPNLGGDPRILTGNYGYAIPINSNILSTAAIPTSVFGIFGLTCMEQGVGGGALIPPQVAVPNPLGKDYEMRDPVSGDYWLMSAVKMKPVKKFLLQSSPVPIQDRKILGTDEALQPYTGEFQTRLMGVGGIYSALRKNAPNSDKYYLLNIGFSGPTNQRDTEFYDNAPSYFVDDVVLNLNKTLLETPDEVAFQINTKLQDSFINQDLNTVDVVTEQFPRNVTNDPAGVLTMDNTGDYADGSRKRQINITSATLKNISANFTGGLGDALNGRNPYDTIFAREPEKWISGMKLLYSNFCESSGGALDFPAGDVDGFRYGFWTRRDRGSDTANFTNSDADALYRNYQTPNADSELILKNIVATQTACIVSNVGGTLGNANLTNGTCLFMRNWVSTKPDIALGGYLGDANVRFDLFTGLGNLDQQPTIFNTGGISYLTFWATNSDTLDGNYWWVNSQGGEQDVIVGVEYEDSTNTIVRIGVGRWGIGESGRNCLMVYKGRRVSTGGFDYALGEQQLDLEIPLDQQTLVELQNYFNIKVRNKEIDVNLRTFQYSSNGGDFTRLDLDNPTGDPALVGVGLAINGLPYIGLADSDTGGALMNDTNAEYVSEWLALPQGFVIPTNMYLTISLERIRQYFRANEVYDGVETEKEKIEADTLYWYVDLDMGWADDYNNALSNFLTGTNFISTPFEIYDITGEESNWSWYGNWFPNIRSNGLFRNPYKMGDPENRLNPNYICPNVIYPCSRYSKNGIISPAGEASGYSPNNYIGSENKIRVHSRWFDKMNDYDEFIKRDNRRLKDQLITDQGTSMMLHPTIKFNRSEKYINLIKEANLPLVGINFYTGNGGGWDENVSPLVGFVNYAETFGGTGRRDGSFYVNDTQQTPTDFKSCWRIATGTPIGFAPESTTNPLLAPLNNTTSNPIPGDMPSEGSSGGDYVFGRQQIKLSNTAGDGYELVDGPSIFSMFEDDSVNFIQVGAINPQLKFINGRMQFTQFHTPRITNALDDSGIGNEGQIVAGFNVETMNFTPLDLTYETGLGQFISTQPIFTPYIRKINTGIDDAESGISIYKLFVRTENADPNDFNFNDEEEYPECKFVNGVPTNYKGCLLNRLGFELEQFKPLFGKTYNRFAPNTYARTTLPRDLRYSGLKYFTTNSEINQSSSQALSLYGENYFYQTTPLNIAGAQNFNLGYSNFQPFFLATQSASLRADNLPSKLQNAYYMIATDLPVSGYRSNNNHMNIIGTFYLQYKGGNFFFSYPVSYSKTITQDYPLSSIRTQILDQSGRIAENLGDHTIVFYKIQTPAQLTTMNPQEVQNFINVATKPPSDKLRSQIPTNFNGRLNKFNQNIVNILPSIRPPSPIGIVDDEDMGPMADYEPFEPARGGPPPAVIDVGPPMSAGGLIPNYNFAIAPPPRPTAGPPITQESAAIIDAIITNRNGAYVNIEDLPFGLDQQIIDIILNDRDDLDLDESPDIPNTGAFFAVPNGFTATQRFDFAVNNPQYFNPQPPPHLSTEGVNLEDFFDLPERISDTALYQKRLTPIESPTNPFELEATGAAAVVEDLDLGGSALPEEVTRQIQLRGKYEPTEEEAAAAAGVMTQEQAEAQFSNVFAPPTPATEGAGAVEPERKEDKEEKESKEE